VKLYSLQVVQPVLRDTQSRLITLTGTVKTSFANETYIEASHKSSLLSKSPLDNEAKSFMSIVYSSRGSNCWSTFLEAWDKVGNSQPGKPVQSKRLAPWIVDKNTLSQINGSWVQNIDIENASSKLGRIVNNVTLAIPHPGILQVARNSSKLIAQPDVSTILTFRLKCLLIVGVRWRCWSL
jgi:hypothetical protein